MSGGQTIGQARAKFNRSILLGVLPVAILAAGYLAQAATYLNHDVSWVLYSSGLMLKGAVFGKSIVAANPPLIWWISAIPNAISGLLGTPLIGTFRLCVLLAAGLSIYIADRFLAAQGASLARRSVFLMVAAYLVSFAVSRDYGQREHLAVLLLLPYILAIAHRIEGRGLSLAGGLAIGIAAGVGVAFKPYFALVPLLLEGFLLWRSRAPRMLVRPEAIGAGLAVALYAIAVLLFARTWLFDALPEISRVYWAFEQPLAGRLGPILGEFLLPAIAVIAVLRLNPSSQSAALALAAAGFFASAILQGKYYSYHLYPSYALLVLAFAAGATGLPRRFRMLAAIVAAVMLAQNLHGSALTLLDRTDRGAFGQHASSVTAFVENHSPAGGSFLAISTHPYPGFPTALYADRRWASASNSALFLPAVVRLRDPGGTADAGLLAFAERKAREAMLRDLALAPDVVLIDQRSDRHAIGLARFDYLDFYLEDRRFRKAWDAYEQVAPAPAGFAAYVRKKRVAFDEG